MKEFIENEFLKVGINLTGGSLTSIFDKKKNEEILYQPEPESWQGQDVAIFPFVARLKNKKFEYKGKEYSLRTHGLCRYNDFKIVEKAYDSLTILFSSIEETLKEYPFEFDFYAKYFLENKVLKVEFDVVNKSKETMPFGIGAHPSFKVNPSIIDGEFSTNGNFIEFSKPISLTRICFDEKGEVVVGEEPFGVKKEIEIDKHMFMKYKTLCVKGDGLNNVVLKRKDGYRVQFYYDNINYFVLWSFVENGGFAAIESWASLPDSIDADIDIMKKRTLIHLPKGESYKFSYSIAIE